MSLLLYVSELVIVNVPVQKLDYLYVQECLDKAYIVY